MQCPRINRCEARCCRGARSQITYCLCLSQDSFTIDFLASLPCTSGGGESTLYRYILFQCDRRHSFDSIQRPRIARPEDSGQGWSGIASCEARCRRDSPITYCLCLSQDSFTIDFLASLPCTSGGGESTLYRYIIGQCDRRHCFDGSRGLALRGPKTAARDGRSDRHLPLPIILRASLGTKI